MSNNVKEDTRYWVALSRIKGVGSKTAKKLLERFSTAKNIFSSAEKDLKEINGLREVSISQILTFRDWTGIDRELERTGRLGFSILTWQDDNYPLSLLNIYDPPIILYAGGDYKNLDSCNLAIVGSRASSSYGLHAAASFAGRLASSGVTIVSGLARGIDTKAHEGALKAGGKTIAVLGSGLDLIYPAENASLFRRILKNGAVFSEFPLSTPPDPQNFPRRNRIISGLSMGVLVVEASLRSGSLITARCALDQGREVYAVPGNITAARSRGTNSLIKEGARLVEKPEEIMSDLLPGLAVNRQKENKRREAAFSLNTDEDKLLTLLGNGPLHIDQLIKESTWSSSRLSTLLLNLELMGAIKQHPGKFFSKTVI
ncbi:MAG: DNA-processing protein DprA [Deltaproteobacteria bacterium]|nr:DNA-processing protein DprA [Deltaproteobacteria bacterium]